MKKFVLSAFILLLFVTPLFAGNTAVQTVKITVNRIAEISVHGNPEIYLDTSVDREAFAEGSYSITVNDDSNIVACINKNLPISLYVSLQSPFDDSFGPEVLLSEQERAVLENISPVAAKDKTIKYRLVCDSSEKYEGTVDVIFTIVD